MEYLLNAEQMKRIDSYSIKSVGIPSLVLMERAALAVSSVIREQKNAKVLCVCGYGNNGADGLAVARQLNEASVPVEVLLVGSQGKTGTEEFERQKEILLNIGIVFRNNVNFSEYNFIIDAIFGIGLSREVSGIYADWINQINQAKEQNKELKIVSIDIPSGIHASTGQVMSVAVKADQTYTFGYNKIGMVRYPGAEYAGEVTVAQIGFAPQAITQIEDKAVTYTDVDLNRIPTRAANSNKGSFGKVLIIAGSENMGGAACLSSLGAYRTGCGLVKVFTHENNRNVVIASVPETIVETYKTDTDTDSNTDTGTDTIGKLRNTIGWASCIILGPGIGMGKRSYDIVKYVLNYAAENPQIPVVIDADALNLIAKYKRIETLIEDSGANLIMTPHMGEMSRLSGLDITELKKDPAKIATLTANRFHAVCVLKDAVTVVSDGKQVYYNTAGNCGMATAGSGDVLTGVIAGMLMTGMDTYQAACMGVYVHARAGDQAAAKLGTFSMKASDITEGLSQILSF